LAAVSRGEGGVIGEHRAGTRDDGIRLRATPVHVRASGGAGDPLARPVRGRGATVEALRPLHRDEGAAETLDGEPVRDERLGVFALFAGFDVDSGIPQALRPAAGDLARV